MPFMASESTEFTLRIGVHTGHVAQKGNNMQQLANTWYIDTNLFSVLHTGMDHTLNHRSTSVCSANAAPSAPQITKGYKQKQRWEWLANQLSKLV